MSQLLLVFGATGQQGGSVIEQVLQDPALSKQYKIRGVTRDASKPAAQALVSKGVEMVSADVDDVESLKKAFAGAHTVYANTVTVYDERTKEREIEQGKRLADAAVAAGVKYYIWSTLPNAEKISKGVITRMGHFDAKALVEDYVRTLPLKSAFFAPASFMSNFSSNMMPFPAGDGTYALSNFVRPDTPMPLINTAGDTGKWIAAILAEPEKYEGKVFAAATDVYTMSEICEAMSKASGKTVKYNQLPENVWRGFLPPEMAENIAEMFRYFQDFGYYGADTNEKVKWSAAQAHGKLTSMEEYLKANPQNLQ